MKQLLQKAAILGSSLALGLSFFAAPSFAQCGASAFCAGDVPGGGPVQVDTGSIGFSSIGQAISTLITFAIFLGAIIAFIFIVIGAFRYVSAGEDAGGTKAARTIITNAVVGLILLALVYVIFQIVIRVVPGLSQFFAPGQGGG